MGKTKTAKVFLFLFTALIALALSTAAKAAPNDDAEKEIIKNCKAAVEAAKRTKFKSDVDCEGISREDFKKITTEDLRKSEDSGGLAALNAVLGFFGGKKETLSADDISEHISGEALGMYIPEKKKFYYLKGAHPDSLAQTAIHELTHAMQDQEVDLDKFLGEAGDNFDVLTARRALVEGEATCVGFEYSLGKNGGSIAKISQDVGQIIESFSKKEYDSGGVFKRWFLFQYSGGAGFIQWYVKNNGWKRVPLLYKNPPLSSEQILHREKYAAGTADYPVSISLRISEALLGDEWEPIIVVVLGEYFLGSLMESSLGGPEARQACIGWDGDQWAFFRNRQTGKIAAVALTTWDSEDDAREFALLYSRHIERTRRAEALPAAPSERGLDRDRDAETWQKSGDGFCVVRRGKEVIIADGVPEARLEAVMTEIRHGAKRTYHPDDRYLGGEDRKTTVLAEERYLKDHAAAAEAKPSLKGNVFTTKSGILQLTFNDDWIVTQNPPNPQVQLMLTHKYVIGSSFNVIETPAIGIGSLSQVADEFERGLATQLENLKVTKKEMTKVAGVEALRVCYTAIAGKTEFVVEQLLFLRQGYLIVITSGGMSSSQEKTAAAAQEIVKTLKFLK